MNAYDIYNYFTDNIKYAALFVGTAYVIAVIIKTGFTWKKRDKK